MHKADSLELWNSPKWKRILLYRDHKWGEESDVDGGSFFLAPDGKVNPRSEMSATLMGLFADQNLFAHLDTNAATSMHPQVKFPLRFEFLKNALQIPDTLFPTVDRTRFERWISALNPQSISVVFASAYLGNPASAMGHTFLRIHSKQNKGHRDILDYGVNYAANTPVGENSFLYSLKGILGFYPGTYGLLPYYVSLQKYIHIENRDLWFYHLNLSPHQQWSLLASLWERGNSWERYFFFTENCSYFVASIVDATLADSVSLLDSIPYAMVPIEIVKGMQSIPGLVDSVSWRPSVLRKVKDRFRSLPRANQHLVQTLLFEDTTEWQPAVSRAGLSKSDLAVVYDMSLEYSLVERRKNKDSIWAEKNEKLLRRRMLLGVPSVEFSYQTDTTQYAPHRVHDPYRMEWGGGMQEYQRFATLGYRLSYQDANQFDEGLSPNNILDFMDFRMRVWQGGKARLDYFRVLQLANYPTQKMVQYPVSWRLDARFDRPPMEERESGDSPLSGYGALAFGYAWDYLGKQRCVGFVLGGGRLRLHPDYYYNTSLGPMLNTGLKLRPLSWLSVLFTSEATYSVLGERGLELHHEGELRLGGPDVELRFYASQWNYRNEGGIRVLHYF